MLWAISRVAAPNFAAMIALGLLALLAGCAAQVPDYRGIVSAPDRSEADRKNDQRRNPVALFGFTGARPGLLLLGRTTPTR
jgi:predicted methyltransferase